MLKYKRDNQRQRAYDWENALICGYEPVTTQQALNRGFMQLRNLFQINKAVISFNERTKFSFQLYHKIFLLPVHYKFSALCHEFAHLVIYDKIELLEKFPIEPHGPEWLSLYMILLHKACGLTLYEVVKSASDCKLRFFEDTVVKFCEAT